MPEKMKPKGSWILSVLIVIFAVMLLTSILYPDKLWDRQEEIALDCQERMENLNFVVQRYRDVKKTYTDNSDSLMAFIKVDSINVRRGLFEFEKLSLYDAENDCLLVGFLDRFHFDSIAVEQVSKDLLVLSILPKKEFAKVILPVKSTLSSNRNIDYYYRGKGVEDIYYIFYSNGKINRTDLDYQEKVVPSTDYLLYRDVNDILIDPITEKNFALNLNAKVSVRGEINYRMLKNGEPENPVMGNELLTNLLVNKMARTARAQVDAALKKDSTLFDIQLQLQSDYFVNELEKINPRSMVTIEDEKEINTPLSSVDVYRDRERIKSELFTTSYDSLIRAWTNLEKTRELLAKLDASETYTMLKVDTIGVTIKPPFDKEYDLPNENLLDAIFSIGAMKNPGNVENGDLSWSEKK